MKRVFSIVLLALIVVVSGCANQSENQVSDTKSTQNLDSHSSEIELEEVVIRLSDFESKYDFTSGLNETRSELSEDRKQAFEEKGVLRQYKRLFTREDGETGVPYQIISTAVVYENESSAEVDLQSNLQNIRSKNGKVVETEISGVTVYEATWEAASDHVTIYRQKDNMLYFVFSTEKDDRDYSGKMRELMEKMIADVEE